MAAARTYDEAVAQVKSAIGHITRTRNQFDMVEASALASSLDRGFSRVAASAAIQEFAHQWENVDLIIREKNL